jgi:hypothetical protein
MLGKKQSAQSGVVHLLIPIVLMVVIGLAVAVAVKVVLDHKSAGSAADVGAKQTDCAAPLLKQSPVKPEELSDIIPLGNLAPPGHVLPTFHMYYNYLHTGTGHNLVPAHTALYVPADMTVTQMMKMDNADLARPYEAFRIDFSLCKQVGGYFILVQQLNDKLAAAMQPPYDRTQESDVGRGKLSHNWYKKVNVQLKAGELLGYAGGAAGDPDGLDMAIIDQRLPAPTLANEARWPGTERHYACSLDYYPEALKTELYGKLGDFNYQPTGTHDCGQVYQDVPGTAQGVWMLKSAAPDGLWDVNSALALVHSNFDKRKGAVSVGNKGQRAGLGAGRVALFAPMKQANVNLDFNLVKPGDTVYCYDLDDGSGSPGSRWTMLLQLTSDKALKVGPGPRSCGSGPRQFSQSLDYVR